MYVTSETTQQQLEQVLYHVKQLEIIIDETKLEVKDIKLDIQKSMDRHDELSLQFLIESSEVTKYMSMIYIENAEISITAHRKTKSGVSDIKRIFMGVIRNVSLIRTTGKFAQISITAYSHSIYMSDFNSYRVFQDPELTYKAIIDEIMESYKDEIVYHVDEKLNEPINRIFIQAGMTDWAFLSYILSTFGEKGLPITAHLSTVVFGFIETTVYDVSLEKTIFSKKRVGKNYIQEITGTDPYNPIECVSLHSTFEDEVLERIVSKSHIWLEKDLIYCTFEAITYEKTDNGFNHIFPIKYNDSIVGRSIEASVLEVGEIDGIAVMTVDFSFGLSKLSNRKTKIYEDKHTGKYPFSYTTMYSQTNMGFFCTPEVNDIVSIFFPTSDENAGYVQGCVNSAGNGRASNPNVRNFSVQSSNDLLFTFQLSSNQYMMFAQSQLELYSKNMLSLYSNSQVSLTASNSTTIQSTASMISLSPSTLSIIGSGTVNVGGVGENYFGGGNLTLLNQ